MKSTAMRVLAALALALSLVARGAAQAPPARFYFSGDGTLDLYNGHFDEHLTVRYRDTDGHYDAGALARIERFFRSRDDGTSGRISLRLIELLDFVEDRFHPRRMTLVSGYRSPQLNQSLHDAGRRVAESSLHTEGLAADVQPAGLDLRRLWLDLRKLQTGGAGLYQRDGFVHLDVGQPRFWEPATSHVEQHLSAENARLFARTDFDRYADLDGAVVRLHAVTALPIGIRREARLGKSTVVRLAPITPGIVADDDCLLIAEPALRYELRVDGPTAPPAKRAPLRLETCAPRIGATPKEIETNPVELLP